MLRLSPGRFLSLAIVFVLGVALPTAQAVTYTWTNLDDGTAVSANWSTGTSWSAVPVSAADTTLSFGYTFATNSTAETNTLTNDIASPFLLNVLTFAGGTPGAANGSFVATVNINGSPLNLVLNGAATPVVNLNSNRSTGQGVAFNVQSDVSLFADTLFTGSGTATFTISGAISSSSAVALTKSGTSALTLSGANSSFAGPINLLAGTLQGNNPNATNVLTAFGTGQITISAGATLQLRADGTGSNQTIITGNGTTGNNVVITGSSTIDVNRNGATSGGNTFRFNNLTVNSSTLTISGGNTYGVQFAGTTTLVGNNTFSTNFLLNLTGAVTSGSGFTKTGTGTVVLNSTSNAISGTIVSNNGTLSYTGSATSGTVLTESSINLISNGGANSNQTTLSIAPGGSGGTLSLASGIAANSTLEFTGSTYLNVNRGSNTSLSYTFGPTAGTSAVLTRTNRGTLILMGSANGGANFGTVEKFIIAGSGAALPVLRNSNTNVDPYILSATNGSGGDVNFVTYDSTNGFKNATTTATLGAGNIVVNPTGPIAANSAAYALKSTNALVINSGITLTIGDGINPAGLIVGNAAAISGGTIDFGGSEGIIAVTGTSSTISSAITGSNGITKTQYNGTLGALTLSGLNTYSGKTTVNSGLLTYSNAGNQSLGSIDGLGTITNAAGAGTLSFTQTSGTFTIGTLTNSTTTGATGALTVTSVAGSNTTIGTVSGASGSQVIMASSSPYSITNITSVLGVAGQLFRVSGGTVTLLNARTTLANLEVTGGTLQVATTRLGMNGSAGGQTLSISGGTLLVPATSDFGTRINGDAGAGGAGTALAIWTGTQSNGTVTIYKGGANTSLSLGSSSTTTTTYTLTGGTVNVFGSTGADGRLDLGADTTGTGKATFTLNGGKVIVSGSINGSQGTAARQAFVFTSGTLATAAYIATNLTSTDGAVYTGNVGRLTNTGTGILAPGDTGVAGLTAITGNYSQGASATLAVDLGGTAAASAFQNGVTGTFDRVTVTGTSSLNGSISLSILPGFRPTNANTFAVLASTGAITAAGGNFNASAQTIATNEGFSTMTATTTTSTVTLGGYTVTNQWAGSNANWSDAQGASSWTASDPNANTAGALFIATPGTVNLVDARTVRNLTFAPATSAFSIGGTGTATLTLDGGTSGAAVISNAIGNNTITAPIAIAAGGLNAGAATGTTLSLSGSISGTGNFAAVGPGTVVLGADNTSVGGGFSGAISVGDAAIATTNPLLSLTNNNALGNATAITVFGSASTGASFGSRLGLGSGVTITGKTLTLAPLGGRATLYSSTGTGTWNGDIVLTSSGSSFLWADLSSTLIVGASTANTITHFGTGALSVRGNGTGTLNSTLNLGTNGLTKTDAGTWTINNTANSFSGNLTVSTGTLVIPNIANSGVISSVGSGATISLGQNAAGSGGVGILSFTGASGGSSNRAISINNGATGGGGTIQNTISGQTLTLSGVITSVTPASASTLTVQGAGNVALTGGISGSPALTFTKTGTGTLTLAGSNTYTGATQVNAGTLLIGSTGTLAALSTVTVGGGASSSGTPTLGGTGTINGAVVISAAGGGVAGTLSTGTSSSPGTLTVNNSVTFNGGSFVWKINNTQPSGFATQANGQSDVGAVNQDRLAITGGTNTLTASAASTFALTQIGSFATALDTSLYYSFTVATTAGAPVVSGMTVNTDAAPDFAAYVTAGGTLALVAAGDGNVYLNLTAAVPEPATVLGISAVGMMLARFSRRRLAR